MVNETARKPDYHIRAMRKGTKEKGEIGVGWKNPDGSIYLKFNPYVVVPVGEDFAITAFPPWKEGERPTGRQQNLNLGSGPQGTRQDMGDDIPF